MNYTYKSIWLINLPVLMSVLIEQLINIADAIFLGHVGEAELGAAALAGVWYLALYMPGFGFSLGLQVVVARRNGEGRYVETGTAFLFQATTIAAYLLYLWGLSHWEVSLAVYWTVEYLFVIGLGAQSVIYLKHKRY